MLYIKKITFRINYYFISKLLSGILLFAIRFWSGRTLMSGNLNKVTDAPEEGEASIE